MRKKTYFGAGLTTIVAAMQLFNIMIIIGQRLRCSYKISIMLLSFKEVALGRVDIGRTSAAV